MVSVSEGPIKSHTTPHANICYSGGAQGADYYWSWRAEKAGHTVVAWSFEGHQFTGPLWWLHELSAAELMEGLPALKLAGIKLNRTGALNANSTTKKLLLRNYHQIKAADRLYAVGFISPQTQQVEGGTGWAVQMFQDRFGGEACECYIYNLNTHTWYKWDGRSWIGFTPPKPEGRYAGIGTRKFNSYGRQAIDGVFGVSRI